MAFLTFKNIDAFRLMKGQSLPNSDWYTVTQKMITDFAAVTLDQQWIHVDEKRAAKESPFKCTVAHGFMSVAMISNLLAKSFTIQSLTMALNYGINKVRFPNAVPVNSELRMLSEVQEITSLEQRGIKVVFKCVFEIKGQEKPACVAEFIAAFFE